MSRAHSPFSEEYVLLPTLKLHLVDVTCELFRNHFGAPLKWNEFDQETMI